LSSKNLYRNFFQSSVVTDLNLNSSIYAFRNGSNTSTKLVTQVMYVVLLQTCSVDKLMLKK